MGLALLDVRVLVLNAGSSSLKVSLVAPDDEVLVEQDFETSGGQVDSPKLEAAVRAMGEVEAVGHRVVHGGPRYPQSVRVDSEVIRYLATITDLAPLHLPASLAAITAVRVLMPRVPAVACFDTAFHSRMPAAAATYAIPLEWRQEFGIRRYGFHGFSHAYSARRATEMLQGSGTGMKVVTCHLGSGASVAAVWGGRSMDTTMGFTPLEGLVMGTRSGSIDPGLVLWLQRHAGVDEAAMTEALDQRSGLLALAGTADMREVLRGISAGSDRARLALDVYVHRLKACIASMAAAMGGLDVLVFTGGVGENAPQVRAETVSGLRFLGLEIDPTLNADVVADAEISTSSAEVPTLVVKAHEDIEVAREVRKVLSSIPRP
ncbi:MAG TPA: acetate/propionate family kinase [Candidatus Dormibacteraeota bacterium]